MQIRQIGESHFCVRAGEGGGGRGGREQNLLARQLARTKGRRRAIFLLRLQQEKERETRATREEL